MFGILYNKIATLYGYTRDNSSKISTYSQIGSFKCTIQPLSVKDGITGGTMFNTKKMYTDYSGLKTGQKVVIDGKTYIVGEIMEWGGTLKKLFKVFINESDGT